MSSDIAKFDPLAFRFGAFYPLTPLFKMSSDCIFVPDADFEVSKNMFFITFNLVCVFISKDNRWMYDLVVITICLYLLGVLFLNMQMIWVISPFFGILKAQSKTWAEKIKHIVVSPPCCIFRLILVINKWFRTKNIWKSLFTRK